MNGRTVPPGVRCLDHTVQVHAHFLGGRAQQLVARDMDGEKDLLVVRSHSVGLLGPYWATRFDSIVAILARIQSILLVPDKPLRSGQECPEFGDGQCPRNK